MTTLRQAAEIALGAMKDFDYDKRMAAIEAVEQALAEQEQEPFAWMFEDDYQRMKTSETYCEVYSVKVYSPKRGKTKITLFTAPPQRKWVGLTDDEIVEIYAKHRDMDDYARLIEAKLKEKNT
jgi:hypothetical protein